MHKIREITFDQKNLQKMQFDGTMHSKGKSNIFRIERDFKFQKRMILAFEVIVQPPKHNI